jgi:putative nucleotidyltransferase with HDIG domain
MGRSSRASAAGRQANPPKGTAEFVDKPGVEPKTSTLPVAGAAGGGSVSSSTGRLLVASRLATVLSHAHAAEEVAGEVVHLLHESFDYHLAVVQRLDPDGLLRVVDGAGPLASAPDFLALEQPVDIGVNGRVVRSGRAAMVNDTRLDSDYLARDPSTDPGSELSLPILVAGSIWGVMNLEQLEPGAFSEEDLLLAHVVASQVGAAIHRCQLAAELEGAFLTTLGVLSDAVELRDSYTADHANEVAALALAVGERLGMAGSDLERLRYGALLHDVGKIGVPGELLRKPGPLSPAERELMDEHSAIGARILERIPFLAPVAPLVRSAHERFDGGGYPDGLAGAEIPPGAMVIAACDAFHAMTSDRSYRQAMSRQDAIAELRAHAGTQFDPEVVEAVVGELA